MVALLPVCGVQAHGEEPEYLTQAGSRTCTLCSATMMLRNCMYINSNDSWQQVTEENVSAVAWTSEGLYWNWSYTVGENTITVARYCCSGITPSELKQALDSHPEGIVLYCGGSAPHGVFLTDYRDDTFYCADPAYGYSGSRIPLDKSLLGERHGDLNGILAAVSGYWYVASHELEEPSYLSECQEYQLETRIRVRWDGYAMSLPCTQQQCETAQKVIPIRCGDFYTAQAVVLNDAGEYWYRVGEDVYISAADAPRVTEGSAGSNLPTEPPDKQEQEVVPLMLFSTIKIPQKY